MARVLVTLLCSTLLACTSLTTYAAPSSPDTKSGLTVTPTRYELTKRAGSKTVGTLTVANNSTKTMDVSLKVREFTVDQHNQISKFSSPKYDWITLPTTHTALAPGKRAPMRYHLTIPSDAASGEYYFSVLASTTFKDETNSKTVQVASLIYLFVDGSQMQRTGTVTRAAVAPIALGSVIPYDFTVKNTGNVHTRLASYVRADGLGWHTRDTSVQQLLLPAHRHTFTSTLPAPFFPGIYTLSYGYTDSVSQQKIIHTTRFFYVPLWAIATLVLLILSGVWSWQHLRKR